MKVDEGDDTNAQHDDDVPNVAAAAVAVAQIIRLEEGAGRRPPPPLPRG